MKVIDHSILDFELNSEANRQIIDLITTGLTLYNQHLNPDPTEGALTLSVESDDGVTIAGLLGSSAYEWMRIDILWVHEKHRRKGIGEVLMAKAEQIGRERGCMGVHLDTHTFQAPRFYEKLGYTIFGKLPNYPGPNDRIYYWKPLYQQTADDA